MKIANEVEDKLRNCKKNIKVAVMGCVVNGPGEAKTSPNVFIYVLLSYYSKCILTADRVIIFLLLPKVRQRVYLPELCEEFRLF